MWGGGGVQGGDFWSRVTVNPLKVAGFQKSATWTQRQNSYLGDASVKNHLPLHGGFWRRICHLYSELEVLKACGEGGNFLSRHHFITEKTSPVRDVNKNKYKADHSRSYWTVSPLLFSRWNAAAHCLHIQHLSADWGYFSRQRKKLFCHLCSLCVTSTNEHIIIRQARDVPLTYKDVSPVISCWRCSLLLTSM
jgi:hypothetical protein